ncbi:hypothetical protein CJ030_MR2G004971 [Morella rubra]|uniref:Uncharacterized protein n=1 Tax=Morella rubra TaxID=262757 RepID=A0A6A1WGX7_9ROSI|nr:hypothetical protein CJ030_MR2G004971 [Morella rubra]
MGCLQPYLFSALNAINIVTPSKPTLFSSTNLNKFHSFKPLKFSSTFVNSSNAESSEPISPDSTDTNPEVELRAVDRPVDDSGDGVGSKVVPVSVKVAMENAKEEKKNKGIGASIARMLKRSEALPDPFPEGDLPEVELIVGDTSEFEDSASSKPKLPREYDSDLYKPKVSSWGVFPRPGNISKTFGGGRVIRPGEVLETTEEKAAKEARTRELLAAYNNKIGLKLDPKLKSECQERLR